MVPAGFSWPEHPDGHYAFVGQINFADLPEGPGRPAELPASGLLSLFYGLDEKDNIFWRDDWPVDFDDLYDWFEEREASGDLPRDYLLGSPSWDSLGYDPTPNQEEHPSRSRWRSLLTLQSHEELNWCGQDGARLMAFIEDDKLRTHDFSRLQVDCG